MPTKILLQLDGDLQPSVFDAVVAVDAGVEQLFRHGGITPDNVRELVHGAMFTRGPDDLRHTAIFVGGSDASLAEKIYDTVRACFFGPLRVSVMLDPNGANTTAAAAVLAAERHLALDESTAVVFGATGPVGSRVVRLLARAGCAVRVVSRDLGRAERIVEQTQAAVPEAGLSAHAVPPEEALPSVLEGSQFVVAAGAPKVQLLSRQQWQSVSGLQVAIDLNAVPPLGIEGIEVTDKAASRGEVTCYGAIGVGGTKMKIHRAALQTLFTASDRLLDAEEIFAIGQDLK